MIANIKKSVKNLLGNELLTGLIKGKKMVFLFHDISDKNTAHYSHFYSTTNEKFEGHIQLLRNYFQLVPLDQLVSPSLHSSTVNYASIVFDDGFRSVYDKAFPYLTALNIPFAIFVNKRAVIHDQLWVSELIRNEKNSEYLEEFYNLNLGASQVLFSSFSDNPFPLALGQIKFDEFTLPEKKASAIQKMYCGTGELKEMTGSGLVSLSSHSANHYVLSRCSDALLQQEVTENAQFIRSISSKPDFHFAIPFGNKEHYDQRLVSVCRKAGYKYIHTTHPNSFSNADLSKDINFIPRIGIYSHTNRELLFMINKTLFQNKNS